ncbi:MAG: GNAT family N-acetyltransferase [Oscillospiraceae bacterium]|nr:GNAT family N-acetyltransferase [Oscillospiraceae bacterium]
MAVTKVYLIRHAEAEGNLYRRLHGWYDGMVTKNGFRQIDALAERFRDVPVDAVYCSDLLRTRLTAESITRYKDIPVNPSPDFREIGMGIWEDLPFGQVAFMEPEMYGLFSENSPEYNVQYGETFEQVRTRMTEGILDLARMWEGNTVAVFSHGVAIRNTIGAFSGLPLEEVAKNIPHGDNTAVSLLEVENDTARVVYYNDASHLSEEISTFAKQMWWRGDAAIPDANLWFVPLDPEADRDYYCGAREDAWLDIHGTMDLYDGDAFLRAAAGQYKADPTSVLRVMLDGDSAGVLQMDVDRDADQGVGFVPFLYLLPQYRHKGLGVQLIGQAVCAYRRMDRRCIRLRCAPGNRIAQHFYDKYGFTKVGEDPNSPVTLDILEKSIVPDDEGHGC